MPFGLANALAMFQNMMHDIFKDMIDLGVVVYLDVIPIYAENEADHIALVKTSVVVPSRAQAGDNPCEVRMAPVKSQFPWLHYFCRRHGNGPGKD